MVATGHTQPSWTAAGVPAAAIPSPGASGAHA